MAATCNYGDEIPGSIKAGNFSTRWRKILCHGFNETELVIRLFNDTVPSDQVIERQIEIERSLRMVNEYMDEHLRVYF